MPGKGKLKYFIKFIISVDKADIFETSKLSLKLVIVEVCMYFLHFGRKPDELTDIFVLTIRISRNLRTKTGLIDEFLWKLSFRV